MRLSIVAFLTCASMFCSCKEAQTTTASKQIQVAELVALQTRHPGLPEALIDERIQVLGAKIDSQGFSTDLIEVALPDSASFRNWEGLSGLFARLGTRSGWSGRFVLFDPAKGVKLSVDLSSNDLDLEDSRGYVANPEGTRFKRGIDRIKRTPRKIGIQETREEGSQTPMTRCDGFRDINGRLFYEISLVSYTVTDRESGVGLTNTIGPILVDAATGEHWSIGSGTTWRSGSKEKTRFMPNISSADPMTWQLVSSECSEEGGHVWQYQATTRTLERIGIDPIARTASLQIDAKHSGAIVSVIEWGEPGDSSYQVLGLLRDGEDFSVLRSHGPKKFTQRWEAPSPSDRRWPRLTKIDDDRFSFDAQEYGLDSLPWVDLDTPQSGRQIPAGEDSSTSP